MSPPGKSTPAEAQPARLRRAQGGPRRLVTPQLSNVSLGGDSHCALQGSLHADGVQCLLLSLGLTYSLKSQHPWSHHNRRMANLDQTLAGLILDHC